MPITRRGCPLVRASSHASTKPCFSRAPSFRTLNQPESKAAKTKTIASRSRESWMMDSWWMTVADKRGFLRKKTQDATLTNSIRKTV